MEDPDEMSVVDVIDILQLTILVPDRDITQLSASMYQAIIQNAIIIAMVNDGICQGIESKNSVNTGPRTPTLPHVRMR
jgi:hypothetical protein